MNYLQYLKDKDFAPNTIATYQRIIAYYGNLTLTTENLTFFIKKTAQKLDPSTCRLYLAALVSYSKYQKKHEEIEWTKFSKLIPRTQKKFYTTINQEELKRLKETRFEKHDWQHQRNNLMLDFLFYSGLRVSELVNIKHRDWQNNCLRVLGKGNKVRYVFLPPFLVEHLKFSSPSYLFTGWPEKKMTTSQVRGIIQRKVKLARINKWISPHTFRRSLATTLYNKQGKLETIQKQLGHANIQTTLNYIHNDFNTLYADYSKLWLGGIHA